MTQFSRIRVVFAVILLSSSLVTVAVAVPNPFRDLVNPQGEIVRLDNAIGDGRWTLVMIWATDCFVCTQQKPEISAFYDKHKSTDINVFGIALDGRDKLKEVNDYLAEHKPTFPNYVGEYAIVAANYQMLTQEQLRGTPTYLLFDPSGELKGNNPGPVSPAAIEKFIATHSQ